MAQLPGIFVPDVQSGGSWREYRTCRTEHRWQALHGVLGIGSRKVRKGPYAAGSEGFQEQESSIHKAGSMENGAIGLRGNPKD
jgi:hypothetical protein